VNDTTQAPATPAPGPLPKRKRQILGPTGLVVMVGAILLFTAVSIVIEVRANTGTSYRATVDVGARIRDDAFRVVFHVTNTGTRPGRPDVCEATLVDLRGNRVGTAGVYLDEPIQPGETIDLQAVGTVAGTPENGAVKCRAMSPG
jgi:hypothetical protein